MRKIVLSALVALSMTAMAQTVTPLNIQIAEPKIDSLRSLYISEPTMYRASLDVAMQALNKNAEEIKATKAELKTEQAHAKEVEKTLKEALGTMNALKKIYAKEESELRSMQKVVEKQLKTLNKQKELNQETREIYKSYLEQQQKELGQALREVAERQRAVRELETLIQNRQTTLQTYVFETQQKALELTKIEARHKELTNAVKSEQKAAKSMQ